MEYSSILAIAFAAGCLVESIFSADLFPYRPAFLIDLSSGPNFTSLLSAPQTYLVVDPDMLRLSDEEIGVIRSKGKILLAYLSVGEAEMQRSYWTEDWTPGINPKFLDKENPDMRERFKIFYWMQEWQNTLAKYMRSNILRRGFSGVYLDALDSYKHFIGTGLRETPGDDMIALIMKLRQVAEVIQPDVLFFANNAPEMYGRGDFFRAVDGLVAHSTWYLGDTLQDELAAGSTNSTLQFLRKARNDAKIILAVDFPTSQENICDFYVRCSIEVFRCAVFDDMFGAGGREC